MRGRQKAGITLAELVVSVGIIGILSFLLPILIKLFNNLAYLQQKSLLQKEAKAVMWQLSYEVGNAAQVVAPGPPNCLQYNSANPQPTAAGSSNYECLQIYTYDYVGYKSTDYEDPAMFVASDTAKTQENLVQIFYEVVQESANKDYNNNGRIDSRPYLLKSTVWDNPGPNNLAPLADSYSFKRPVFGFKTGTRERREVFFPNRISRTGTPGTFDPYTSAQTIKVTFKLKSSYDKPQAPPRLFSSVVTMSSLPAW